MDKQFPDPVPMDCRRFRKLHLAYLDDTLSGDATAEAQQHILRCMPCAAHDTLVRRSLMIARSMPTIEPSSDFHERLRARLAQCRHETTATARATSRPTSRPTSRATAGRGNPGGLFDAPIGLSRHRPFLPRAIVAVAAGVVAGTMFWQSFASVDTPVIAMQPVIASEPAAPSMQPMYSPALISAMSTGNPVWPAAMLVEEAPTQFVSSDFRLVSENR